MPKAVAPSAPEKPTSEAARAASPRQVEKVELSVTLKGTVEDVVQALACGLPQDALRAVRDALDEELQKPRGATCVLGVAKEK